MRDNAAGLFLHNQIVNSLKAETGIFMLSRLGFFALVILAWTVVRRFNLPTLKPWLDNEERNSI